MTLLRRILRALRPADWHLCRSCWQGYAGPESLICVTCMHTTTTRKAA